jgi:hypothetical protein
MKFGKRLEQNAEKFANQNFAKNLIDYRALKNLLKGYEATGENDLQTQTKNAGEFVQVDYHPPLLPPIHFSSLPPSSRLFYCSGITLFRSWFEAMNSHWFCRC